jgi:hypothetical protein
MRENMLAAAELAHKGMSISMRERTPGGVADVRNEQARGQVPLFNEADPGAVCRRLRFFVKPHVGTVIKR